MNHIIVPRSKMSPQCEHATNWIPAPALSLSGCFYDHFRSDSGAVVGVRYWTIEHVNFSQHAVFSNFLQDPRFAFDENNGYVDVLFDDSSIDAFKKRQLILDAVQDFGGEAVLACAGQFGISFDITDQPAQAEPRRRPLN